MVSIKLLLFVGAVVLQQSTPVCTSQEAQWQEIAELTDASYSREAVGVKSVLFVYTDQDKHLAKWSKLLASVQDELKGTVSVRRLNGGYYKANPAAPHVVKYPTLLFLHGEYVSGIYGGRRRHDSVSSWVQSMAVLDERQATAEIERLVAAARARIDEEETSEARQDDERFAASEALYARLAVLADRNYTAALQRTHATVLFMTPSCDDCPRAALSYLGLSEQQHPEPWATQYFVNVDQSKRVPGYELVHTLPAVLYYRSGVPTAELECKPSVRDCYNELQRLISMTPQQALERQQVMQAELQSRLKAAEELRRSKAQTASTVTGHVKTEL